MSILVAIVAVDTAENEASKVPRRSNALSSRRTRRSEVARLSEAIAQANMSLEESNAAAATADGLAADLEAERAAQRAQVAAFQDVLARVMELREEIQNNAPTGEAQNADDNLRRERAEQLRELTAIHSLLAGAGRGGDEGASQDGARWHSPGTARTLARLRANNAELRVQNSMLEAEAKGNASAAEELEMLRAKMAAPEGDAAALAAQLETTQRENERLVEELATLRAGMKRSRALVELEENVEPNVAA